MDTQDLTIDDLLYANEPVAPSSSYGCGHDECVACYGNEAWRYLNCPGFWLEKQFEYENCDECCQGEENHEVLSILGNFFAHCLTPAE